MAGAAAAVSEQPPALLAGQSFRERVGEEPVVAFVLLGAHGRYQQAGGRDGQRGDDGEP